MYTSFKSRHKIVLLIFGGIACSLAFITYYVFQRQDSSLPATVITTPIKQVNNESEKHSIGSPVRITIPAINVNAILEYVGLTPEGEMDDPTEADSAAWLNRHPLPGEAGTSVIAGHFGLKDNKPAVFDNLHKLRKGDEIYVKDSKGADIVFIVQELRSYVPKQDAAEVFSSSDGKSHLNLITCKGAWNKTLKSYDTRLVVFADRTAL